MFAHADPLMATIFIKLVGLSKVAHLAAERQALILIVRAEVN